VGGAARKALAGFYQLVSCCGQGRSELRPARELADLVYAHTGYAAMLAADDDPENEARRENVAELLGSMKAYSSPSPRRPRWSSTSSASR
jgi:superfamily I DNA/RNA helicase